MGREDMRVIDYFEDNQIFADMENAYFFGGQQIVRPECLQEAHKELIHMKTAKGKKVIRDNVKKYFSRTEREEENVCVG